MRTITIRQLDNGFLIGVIEEHIHEDESGTFSYPTESRPPITLVAYTLEEALELTRQHMLKEHREPDHFRGSRPVAESRP